jgi:UDP-glucose:(heptosyl)LPS alpha-1,3-glucosyltransferase
MRVGIVIDDLDRRRGGMSEWCWQFVEAAAKRGYQLHLISQGFGDELLPANVSRHKIDRTRSRLTFASDAERLLRELKLDIVHDTGMGWRFDLFHPHGGAYPAWLDRRLDLHPSWYRAVKRPIDAILPRHRDYLRHWQRQWAAVQGSDKKVIALSNMVASDFARLPGVRPEQITVVYNGIDCRRFSPEHRAEHRAVTRRTLGVDDETLLLFLAAHNFRLKGLPELLRVAARLVSNGRAVHLVVAGGKRLQTWRRAAEGLGLAGRIDFLGTVRDLVPYYAGADAYIQPTYYDPCSLVLLEAAASGLPIVTTRSCNGVTELFREGESILTVKNPTEHDAIYERVEALYDERLRVKLGAAARKLAQLHSFDKNVAEILTLYDGRVRHRTAA